MARIPVYNQQVRSQGISPPRAAGPGPSGLDEFGRGLQQAGGAAFQIAEDVRQRVGAVQTTDVETGADEEWIKVFHDDQNGLKAKRGQAAFADGADVQVIEHMEKWGKDNLLTIKDERFRGIAEARWRQKMVGFTREMEGYVGQQRRVAEVTSVTGRQAIALDSIARNYADPVARAQTIAEVESPILALADSSEAGQADVAEWRKKADQVVLNGYLQDKDTAGAKAYFAQAKDRLGTDAGRFQGVISKLELAEEADKTARGIIAGAARENGITDSKKALADFEKVEFASKDQRDATKAALASELKLRESVVSAEAGDLHRTLFADYNKNGWSAIQGPELERLNELRPDLYANLKADAVRKADKWKREQAAKDKPGSLAHLRRAQSDQNKIARNRFLAMEPDERADADLSQFIVRPDIAGEMGVDEVGLSDLERIQEAARQGVQRGDSVRETAFRNAGLAQLSGVHLSKKRKAEYVAELTNSFNDFVRDNKRPPGTDETQKLIDPLILKHKKGWLGEEHGFSKRARERQEGILPPGAAPRYDDDDEGDIVLGEEPVAAGGIPNAARDRIIADYQAHFQTDEIPSDADIRRGYEAGRRNGVF